MATPPRSRCDWPAKCLGGGSGGSEEIGNFADGSVRLDNEEPGLFDLGDLTDVVLGELWDSGASPSDLNHRNDAVPVFATPA